MKISLLTHEKKCTLIHFCRFDERLTLFLLICLLLFFVSHSPTGILLLWICLSLYICRCSSSSSSPARPHSIFFCSIYLFQSVNTGVCIRVSDCCCFYSLSLARSELSVFLFSSIRCSTTMMMMMLYYDFCRWFLLSSCFWKCVCSEQNGTSRTVMIECIPLGDLSFFLIFFRQLFHVLLWSFFFFSFSFWCMSVQRHSAQVNKNNFITKINHLVFSSIIFDSQERDRREAPHIY